MDYRPRARLNARFNPKSMFYIEAFRLQIRVGRFDSGPRLHHLERNQSLGLASQAEEVPPATTVLLDPCDPRRRRITILAIDELQE